MRSICVCSRSNPKKSVEVSPDVAPLQLRGWVQPSEIAEPEPEKTSHAKDLFLGPRSFSGHLSRLWE